MKHEGRSSGERGIKKFFYFSSNALKITKFHRKHRKLKESTPQEGNQSRRSKSEEKDGVKMKLRSPNNT